MLFWGGGKGVFTSRSEDDGSPSKAVFLKLRGDSSGIGGSDTGLGVSIAYSDYPRSYVHTQYQFLNLARKRISYQRCPKWSY